MHNIDLLQRMFPQHAKAIVTVLSIISWVIIGAVLVWMVVR